MNLSKEQEEGIEKFEEYCKQYPEINELSEKINKSVLRICNLEDEFQICINKVLYNLEIPNRMKKLEKITKKYKYEIDKENKILTQTHEEIKRKMRELNLGNYSIVAYCNY